MLLQQDICLKSSSYLLLPGLVRPNKENNFWQIQKTPALLINMFLEGLGQKYFKIWQNSVFILIQMIYFTAPFKLFGRNFCHLATSLPSHSWECYKAFIAQRKNKQKISIFVTFYWHLRTENAVYKKIS